MFVTFEFPGPNYFADKDHRAVKDPNDKVIVTYSSINTNSFEPYGECVMGSHATMLVEQERDVMLFPERNPNKPAGSDKGMTVTVTTASAGKPSLDSSGSTGALEPAKALATDRHPCSRKRPAAAIARRWNTSPTACACGTRARTRKTGLCRVAMVESRWPMRLSP